MEELKNKVAASGLITIDPADFCKDIHIMSFDIIDGLYMKIIVKEKEFREFLKNHDWEPYRDKKVALFCSADAIIPTWAYMLAASCLQDVTPHIYFGRPKEYKKHCALNAVSSINTEEYTDQRIVIKGCGDEPVIEAVYIELIRVLKPVVKSIMYGEPCSTVPLYKKK